VSGYGSLRIHEIVALGRERGASDVHLAGNEAAVVRLQGRLDRLHDRVPQPAEIDAFLRETLDEQTRARFDQHGNGDAGLQHPRLGPLRIHAFRGHSGTRVAIRLLVPTVPALERLGLPAAIAGLASRHSGLVLFTGPTGSGKSTAMAALIDKINRTQERHIVTIEDPVEYVQQPVRSLIVHCEVGRDVSSFAEALRGVMRADPDVIMVGEMRDRETMTAALAAAETGHFVLATVHTAEAATSADRLIDAFPAEQQPQVRAALAQSLVAVIGTRLVPLRTGRGRCAAAEVMIASDAIRAMIREGKTHQLRNAIATGRSLGMQTLESHLCELVARGEVSIDEARKAAEHPAEVRELAREIS
jgi:twitching motility protein PilT